ncbi:hypothetical protein [Phreatobacter sp. AB_2022a]|uniref:hypothetical protein n=1 Tax=Phreatobacter sp. AB_2022a TaxID=3003134 RepID=UPI002287197D|nr:hypothetical protein [Phreatobacter sp. AB_2022a]MCZ0732929.1 hypothetical protein [Phreatobacter sp. AB_2022a]
MPAEATSAPAHAGTGPLHRVKRLVLAAALCLAALLASPAFALTSAEATKVADLIAALQPSLGKFAYDEEIARSWFEQDSEDRGLIRAAGFTAESWEKAVGETFRGLMALTPQSEIDALRRRLDAARTGFPQLSAAQRAELLQSFEEEFARTLKLRAEGAAFADIVRPIAPRLNALIQRDSN